MEVSACSTENTLKSLSFAMMNGCYFQPCWDAWCDDFVLVWSSNHQESQRRILSRIWTAYCFITEYTGPYSTVFHKPGYYCRTSSADECTFCLTFNFEAEGKLKVIKKVHSSTGNVGSNIQACFRLLVSILFIGGWTQISYVKNPTAYVDTYMTDDIRTLSVDGNFALSSQGLSTWRSTYHFTQLRFYCSKPSVGLTIDLMTNENTEGENAIRFLLNEILNRPPACNSYTKLPDDTSVVANQCNQWGYSGRWGFQGDNLYEFPFFTSYASHFCIGTSVTQRYECDDYTVPTTIGFKVGIWSHYVR